MSADIAGTRGTNFAITISAGTILSAYLEVTNKPKVALAIAGNGREVTVPSLPAGQSWVRLDIVWAPGDTDAVIDVDSASVKGGTVSAADPKHTLDAGKTPGYVELFGK